MKKTLTAAVIGVMMAASASFAGALADAEASAFGGTSASDFAVTFASTDSNTLIGVETYGLDEGWYEADSSGITGGDNIAFDGGAGMESKLKLGAEGEADGGFIVPSYSEADLAGSLNSAGAGDVVTIQHLVLGEVNVDGFDTNWVPDDANADGSGLAASGVQAGSVGTNLATASGNTVASMEVQTVAYDGLF